MTSSIAVLGANGVYARHLIPRLSSLGHDVRALARRPQAATVARACGADVRQADIFDTASMRDALGGCDIAINLATSLPGPSGRGDFAANDRLRRDGVPHWLRACEEAGVERVIQQSIGLINASGDDTWSDENTVADADPATAIGAAIVAARDMEASVRGSGLDWIILRGGLFYGPGTGTDDDWFERAGAGTLRLPGDGSAFVSFVHVADMAAATVAAVEHWPSHHALIVADDRPARWADVFAYITAVVGGPDPEPGGRLGFPSMRLRNGLARDVLAWTPVFADHRSGFAR